MNRNNKGIIGYFILSLVFSLLTIFPMVGREIYQWKKYKLSKFEWDDVWRYGFTILIGSILQMAVILFFVTL